MHRVRAKVLVVRMGLACCTFSLRFRRLCYAVFNIRKWVDAHANLPNRARWIAKADVAPQRSNQAVSVEPFLVQEGLCSICQSKPQRMP